jgi:Spy/CpxP family protein refolding chaperone
LFVLITGLAAFAPVSRALQPEPRMMFDSGVAAAAERPLVPPLIHQTPQQQDRLLELRHAHEPALRAHLDQLRDARGELRAIALARSYDATRAKQAGARAVQASGAIESMNARLQNAVLALLTPEQRRLIDEDKPGGGPPPGCVTPE